MLVYTASLLDDASLVLAACTALAEIGRRHAVPLQDGCVSSADQLTTDQCVPLTVAAVVETLVNKVKSTSESAKVSRVPRNLRRNVPFLCIECALPD